MRLHALCLALLAAGCVDEGEVEYGEETGEIVGGASSTLRPEIGQFMSFGGSACTATLIGPSLAITAAQCLTPQYRTAAPGAGSVFTFTDISGVPRSVSVDRVHSFGTQSGERTGAGSPWFTDIALLHLVTPVPPTQAVPAEIAGQEPVAGQVVSMFGFGCTFRESAFGMNVKRRFTFNYGTNTTALCNGDFGGPAVYGAGGAIWGIGVGYANNNINASGRSDLWANVVFYKKQIEAIERLWEGYEVGWDRAGHDYANFVVSAQYECRLACNNDGNCHAFTFRPTDRMCWLKSAASEPIVNPLTVTGLPAAKQYGYDRYGGADFANFSVTNPDACAFACARDSRCASWNFNNGQCWLKSDVPPVVYCPSCISGVVRRGQELGWDRPGNTYVNVSATSVEQCAQRCAIDAKCESYSQVNGTCSLKDSVPPAIPTSSPLPIGSGVRRGLDINTDRPGMTYSTFSTQELTPNTCQAACARDGACQSWSYQAPTWWNGNATCELKSGVPAIVSTIGPISGVKGLEMLP